MLPPNQILAGPHLLCYINGYLVGRVTSFSFNNKTNVREIAGLDYPMLFEIGAASTRVNGSLGLLRMVGDGGAQGIGIMQSMPDVARGKYFTLTVIDRHNGLPVFVSNYCFGIEESWEFVDKNLVSGSVSFSALIYGNEVSG